MNEFVEFEKKLLKNNSQLALNKFGVNLLYPNSEDSIARRDYVKYRLGASFQSLRFLKSTISGYQKHYLILGEDTGDKLQASYEAIDQVSYCFDNLIFNLASLSDYFGNYLGLYLFGPKSQTLKWSGFVNKSAAEKFDENFEKLTASEHKHWFTKLHSYRGDIIHRKVILVEIDGFANTKFMPNTVDKFDFSMNDSLKKYFHIFRNSDEKEVYNCANEICIRTIEGLQKLLDVSESVIFDEKFKKICQKA